MSYKIKTQEINGQSQVVFIDKCPDGCPICHSNLNFKFVAATYHRMKVPRIQVVFRCMKTSCTRLFIATYALNGNNSSKPLFSLINVEPTRPQLPTFPAQVYDVSPRFVEIFHQAIIAESSELIQLMGVGFCRSLEYLIKDFLISRKPDQKEKVKTSSLPSCVENYIDDPRIKQCAKLATWLHQNNGSDLRNWDEKDIKDLKILIKLTINWIESSILTEEYTREALENIIPK